MAGPEGQMGFFLGGGVILSYFFPYICDLLYIAANPNILLHIAYIVSK